MDLIQTGRFISALRKQKNMTQKELAEKIGVTDKAVSRWETGKGFPDVSLLTTLANALGASVSEIVTGERIEITEERAAEIMDKTVMDTLDYSQKEIDKNKRKSVVTVSSLILLSLSVMLLGFWLVYGNMISFWSDIPSRYAMYMALTFIAIPIATPAIISAIQSRYPALSSGKILWLSLLTFFVLIMIATAFFYPEFYQSMVDFETLRYDFDETALDDVLFGVMPISLILTLACSAVCYVLYYFKKNRTEDISG